MSQCLKPKCLYKNPKGTKVCQKCKSNLLLANRYLALRMIGQGGFGRTFLAVDLLKPSKPRCVIKQFLPGAQGTSSVDKAAELFAQEAIRLDDLGKHPQIPELMAYLTQDGHQYLIQEFINGQNLAQELASQGVFNEPKIKQVLTDMLEVLKFVHDNNVIHRDIKPSNIIRRKSDGKLVLVDFGAAKEAINTDLSVTGTVIGSVQYIAPEQARGKPKFSSDLYSLGATCIHLLTKKKPFELFDDSEGSWVWKKYLAEPVSDELAAVLDKLIKSATKRRYQSAEEALAALKNSSSPMGNRTLEETLIRSPSQPVTTSRRQPPAAKLKPFQFEVTNVNIVHSGFFGKKATVQTEIKGGKAKYISVDLGEGVNMDMVLIPGGKFQMGSPEDEQERGPEEGPQHLVTISRPFFMGKYPVTQKQWQKIMKKNPAKFKDKGDESGAGRPVERVSWFDCVEFCQKLSEIAGREFRLPTEAEWEYACRANTTTPFHFGATITSELANYNGTYTYGHGVEGEYRQGTTEVGIFSPNAFGLYDMHGNVWEWCMDTWHDNYNGAPADTSAWVSGDNRSDRVLRGGSWLYVPGCCRSAYRLSSSPKNKSDAFGFRVVCL